MEGGAGGQLERAHNWENCAWRCAIRRVSRSALRQEMRRLCARSVGALGAHTARRQASL